MTPIVPKTVYLWVWVVLEVLVGVSWGVSRFGMGVGNLVVPLLIAFTQMLLVMLYFMHVRSSPRLLWLFAAAGFIWLLILIDLTLSDYLTRGPSWSQ